jgi:hypothetical protein
MPIGPSQLERRATSAYQPRAMATDWKATGDMLQGIGETASALAIAFAAYIGRNTFTSWRRQRQEERRMQAAESILTLAYQLRYNFRSVRTPLIDQSELDEAENVLRTDSGSWWDRQPDTVRRRAKIAQAIMNRLRRHHDDWQRIWELKPLALAFFGSNAERDLDVFWQQYVSLLSDAEAFANVDDRDGDGLEGVRDKLFRQCEDSVITQTIDRAVASLEAELQPTIYAQSKLFR